MFLHVSVILSTGGGGYPSMHCRFLSTRGLVSPHALQVSRPTPRGGGGSLGVCLVGSPGPHPGWKLRGLALGEGVSRPTLKGKVDRGGLQVQTWGVSRPVTHVSVHTWGLGIPAPPSQTATAAGGTHPTGMHSCCCIKVCLVVKHVVSILPKPFLCL